jgi:hypothetical protein
VVAHVCNSRYSGGRDPGNSWFEAGPGKVSETPISTNNNMRGGTNLSSQLLGRHK